MAARWALNRSTSRWNAAPLMPRHDARGALTAQGAKGDLSQLRYVADRKWRSATSPSRLRGRAGVDPRLGVHLRHRVGIMRALSATLLLALWPRIAAADDAAVRSPLAAAPAAGHKAMRDHRIAVASLAGAAFAGAGQPSLLYGAEALYHPVNELGVGVWGAGGSPLRGDGAPGAVRGILSPEIVLVPLQGRGDLVERLWFAYDLHIDVGGAWVHADARSTGALPLPAAGVGALTFWNAWGGAHWSLGVDYRALLDRPCQMVVLSLGLWPRNQRDGTANDLWPNVWPQRPCPQDLSRKHAGRAIRRSLRAYQSVAPTERPYCHSFAPARMESKAVGATRIPRTSRTPKGWRRNRIDSRWNVTGKLQPR